jgi:uncharacterized protein YkwD
MRRPELSRAAPLVAALVVMALGVMTPSAAAQGSGCEETAVSPASASEVVVRAAVRCLVNETRARSGLAPLRPSAALNRAAEAHCADMVARHYFEHIDPEGHSVADRARRAGYMGGAPDWSLGEDIGWGTGSESTPAAMVRAWMHSPPHRRGILDRSFRDIGVGVAPGDPPGLGGGATYVIDLGEVA